MKIGIDIKAFKNGTTGIARYLRSMLDELQQLDMENEYALFSCAPSDYRVFNSRWKKHITPWRFPGIIWLLLVLPMLLKKYRIDVLWAPEQICPVFFTGSVRIITTVHDLAFLRFPSSFVWSNRWIQKLFFPLTVSRSWMLIPVSDSIGKEIRQSYPYRCGSTVITTIHNAGHQWKPPATYAASNRGDFLFFAGNLEPRKNLVRVIRALEQLREKDNLTIPLHLAGPAGWKNQSLHELINRSPLRNDIRHLGYISETELRQQYLTCRALIYPSLYEGFGIPVIEALSLDCLVLTSKGTVMEEIAGDSALYFDPQSVESISETIRQCYDHSFQRSTYLKNRISVVERYSWRKSAQELLSVFSPE